MLNDPVSSPSDTEIVPYSPELGRVQSVLTRKLLAEDDWAISAHAAIALAVEAASENTRIAWRQDWAVFRAWLTGPAKMHYPDERLRIRLPVLPDVLVAFVRDMRAGVEGVASRKPATVRRYLSTLSALHRMLDIPDPTKSSVVASAIKTASRGAGDQHQAAPLRWDDIKTLFGVLPDTTIGLRDKALLAVGHDSMARRSELVAFDISDVTFRQVDALIALRPLKTDPEGKVSWRYLGPETVRVLRAWLTQSGLSEGPLFTMVARGGYAACSRRTVEGTREALPYGRRLDVEHVSMIVKTAAAVLAEHRGELELPTSYAERRKVVRAYAKDYSGHSLRVGAAQDLVEKGIGMPAIMLAGGWSSEGMVRRYTRQQSALESGMAQYHRPRTTEK